MHLSATGKKINGHYIALKKHDFTKMAQDWLTSRPICLIRQGWFEGWIADPVETYEGLKVLFGCRLSILQGCNKKMMQKKGALQGQILGVIQIKGWFKKRVEIHEKVRVDKIANQADKPKIWEVMES